MLYYLQCTHVLNWHYQFDIVVMNIGNISAATYTILCTSLFIIIVSTTQGKMNGISHVTCVCVCISGRQSVYINITMSNMVRLWFYGFRYLIAYAIDQSRCVLNVDVCNERLLSSSFFLGQTWYDDRWGDLSSCITFSLAIN